MDLEFMPVSAPKPRPDRIAVASVDHMSQHARLIAKALDGREEIRFGHGAAISER
jgi:hypothetical protein